MKKVIAQRIRRRYIGYIIDSDKVFSRGEMIKALKFYCDRILGRSHRDVGLLLVRFNGRKGIVRCNHLEKEDTIKLLTSIDEISGVKVNIRTISTSGTIKALLRRKPILRDLRREKPRFHR